jgi:hypothetical protein
MATINVEFGGRTRVAVASLYKIEEETADRLVLRAKKIGAYLGGAFLTVIALIFLSLAAFVVGSRDTGIRITVAVLGLLSLWGGIALIRHGIRNKDRIIFDRKAGAVRFDMTNEKDSYSIPFAQLEKVDLRKVDRSTASEERILFQVLLLKKGGDEIKVDEGSNPGQMLDLALKAATLCGLPFPDTSRI